MSEEIYKLFKLFIGDILNVFPEYTERLNNYYKDIIDSDEYIENPKLNEFLENISLISDRVVEKDVTLFQSDPIILQNVSFKLIWNSDITSTTKNSIWKYLQTFCMLKIKLESSDKINDVIKTIESNQKVRDKKTVENMKKLKKLNESFDTEVLKKVVDENPESLTNNIGELDKMFGETDIGKIAKEITDDLDIEGIMKNGGGIEDIFNGGNMMNIIQSISSKVSNNSEGNPEHLLSEATNICNSMQGNPLFSTLMNMQSGLMGNMGLDIPNVLGEDKKEDIKDPISEDKNTKNINIEGPNNPNKTQQRLRKKLEEKKKLNVEKMN